MFVSWYPLAATTFSLCNIPREAWLNCRIISLSLRNLESCKGPLKHWPEAETMSRTEWTAFQPQLTYVITPILELSLIYFQYMDQESNFQSLLYLTIFAILKLTMKQLIFKTLLNTSKSCGVRGELHTKITDF